MSEAAGSSVRARRLGGWGFTDTTFPPSEAMLSWLESRLGELPPGKPAVDELPPLPQARALPEIPGRLSTDPRDRLEHARGQGLPDLVRWRSGAPIRAPDAVLRPADSDEIERLLATCAREEVRVIPWGGGTSVTGGVNVAPDSPPVITVDLSTLNALEAVDAASGLATLGAGASGPQLERALAEHGLTLGHFPQSWEVATLGGWIVTRSSGQESAGYGRIEDMVAGLELVAPAGRLELPPLPASAAGPDLRELVLGSEGRLGVVTRATVRVRPRPAHRAVEGFLFPTWSDGLEASRRLAQAGVPIGMLRLSDQPETEVAMAVGLGHSRFAPLIRRWLALRGVASGCLMLLGASGERRSASSTLRDARSLLGRHGAVRLGTGPGRSWLADRFRHPYLRDGLLDRGVATDTLETAAPWSRLNRVRDAVRTALEGALAPNEATAVLCHVSHPYRDGASLYFTFFFRCGSECDQALERWACLKRAATEAIVQQGAALSHHHGVGVWHAPWLVHETGEVGHSLLKAAAQVMDPTGVLNPGVLLDPSDRLEQ
jgi:alkyldihydroxyacetonephosphate synthase